MDSAAIEDQREGLESQLAQWKNELLQALLRAAAVAIALAIIVCLWQVYLERIHWGNAVIAGGMLATIGVALRLPPDFQRYRILTLSGIFYCTGALGSLGGLVSLYGAGFVGFVAVCALLLGPRGGFTALALTIAHTICIVILYQQEWITPLMSPDASEVSSPLNWARALLFVLAVSVIVAASITSLVKRLELNLQTSLQLITRLESEKHQRVEMKERVLRSQRMEALGRLSAGIAHDFNNALTVMGGEADYIVSEIGEGHPIGESAEIIRLATERASVLTRSLLLLGRHKEFLQPEPVDLLTTLNEFMRICRRVLPEPIELTLEESESTIVELDDAALHQTLLNLAINAGDAMNQEGRIGLACGPIELRPGDSTLPPGKYGYVSVTDNGTGIAPESLGHIFDPFYTTDNTKKSEGSGMGLASSFTFASASGGTIEVESKLGEGSIFTLYFPLSEKTVKDSSAYLSPTTELGKGQVALIAEDNLRVRAFMWSALHDAGYEVLEAADGKSALELVQDCQRPISIVVTDYRMPHMDGVTLARHVHQTNPDAKIVLVTGYATAGANKKLQTIPNTALLPKPFGRRELYRTLQHMEGTV